LQRRSEAIRTALSKYNTQASKLNPPCPSLSWKKIVDYSFLAEFDLLRLTRTDIRQAEWTAPARREGTTKYFKLCRAREEIVRLNIEICRLRTAIRDEEMNACLVIAQLSEEDPALSAEIRRRWSLRSQVNKQLIQQLDQVESLDGFSGQQGATGVRSHTGLAHRNEGSPPISGANVGGVARAEDDEAEEIEELARDVANLAEFMENIYDWL
jgi:hypothetical protein